MPQSQDRIEHPLDIPGLIKECLKVSFLKDVRFSNIYPDEKVMGPVIVWRMVRRVLGKEGKETKKPRIRGTDQGQDAWTIFYGQWTTAVFQFDLLAPSDIEVDELMRRFELFLVESRAAIALRGVDSFIFEEQLQDYTLPIPKEIPCRSLRYTATMSTLYPTYAPRIHQITLSVATDGNYKTQEVTRSTDSDSDPIEAPVLRIMGIGDYKDTTDYVSGVDYDLIDNGDRTTTVKWRPYGLRPQAGASYYVRYTALIDPTSLTVAG